jgi:hypothetical protein
VPPGAVSQRFVGRNGKAEKSGKFKRASHIKKQQVNPHRLRAFVFVRFLMWSGLVQSPTILCMVSGCCINASFWALDRRLILRSSFNAVPRSQACNVSMS